MLNIIRRREPIDFLIDYYRKHPNGLTHKLVILLNR